MMHQSLVLNESCILLAGSISSSTDKDQINKAHSFVEAFVKEVIVAGGSFVIYVAAEPVNENQKPLIFDWIIARTVDKLISGESQKARLKIVATQERLQSKANPEQRRLINGLIARGIAELIPLEDETLTGGNVGDEQIVHATAMLALGGGKGVLDRARKMSKLFLPVLPLDLQLGANSEDGTGALGVLKLFYNSPLNYMPHTGGEVVKSLSALSLQEPVLELSEISKRILSIYHNEEMARKAALPPEVLVLTALDVELAAAKQAFGIAEDATPTITNTGYHVWTVPVNRRDRSTVSCVIACFAGAGNYDAAAVTATLLTELKPNNVMMLGIAAGMRGKCSLGEVILVDRVVAYEGAALVAGGNVEARPEIYRLNMKVRQDLSTYLSNRQSIEHRLTESYKSLEIVFPKSVKAAPVAKDIMPKTATIGSGEKLLRDPEKFRALRELNGKVEAAEMEAAGLFAACTTHNKPVLMIRGISDFGDASKNSEFHLLAAKAAAAVTADYIANGLTL